MGVQGGAGATFEPANCQPIRSSRFSPRGKRSTLIGFVGTPVLRSFPTVRLMWNGIREAEADHSIATPTASGSLRNSVKSGDCLSRRRRDMGQLIPVPAFIWSSW
jgi:hypothetical protein